MIAVAARAAGVAVVVVGCSGCPREPAATTAPAPVTAGFSGVGRIGDREVVVVLPAGAAGVTPGASGQLTWIRTGDTLALAGACPNTPSPSCTVSATTATGAAAGRIEGTFADGVLSGTWTPAGSEPPAPLTLDARPGAAVVYGMTEVWTRPGTTKPTTSFEVTLPRVRVVDPVAQGRIDAALTPEALLGDPQAQIEADGWVDAARFETTLNRDAVLSLLVTVEGSGAYPDSYNRAVVLDLLTGGQIGADTLSDAGRTALVARVSEEVAQRKAAADPEVQEMLAPVAFTDRDLVGFEATEQGLGFFVPWGLPHAIAAASPDPVVTVAWAEVAPNLAPGSPLARVAAAR